LVGMSLSCHKVEVASSNNGNLKFYGGGLDDVPTAAIQTSDGGFAITGYTNRNLNDDMFLLKLDHNGNQQWFRTYGGPNDDVGNALVQTADGGYLVTGSTNSFGKAIKNNSTALDVYAVRTNPNGDTIWTKTYGYQTPGFGTYGNDYANAVCNDPDGTHYIGGYTGNNYINDSVWPSSLVVKIKDNGQVIWSKPYNPGNSNTYNYNYAPFLTEMVVDKNDHIILGSYTDSFIINKISPNGTKLWSARTRFQTNSGYLIGIVNNLAQKSDGSYSFLATGTNPFGNVEVLIDAINVSFDGNIITRMPIDSFTAVDIIACSTQLANGDFIVAASLMAKAGSPVYDIGTSIGGFKLLRFDNTGKTTFIKTLDGWPLAIFPDNQGNYFIVGYNNKYASTRTEIFTEWVDSKGVTR